MCTKQVQPLSEPSIAAFFERHLGRSITETLIEALMVGIFAGDSHALSLPACFPALWQRLLSKGTLWRARPPKTHTPYPLFSFAGGLQTLTDALYQQLPLQWHLSCPIDALHFSPRAVTLCSGNENWEFDTLFSTLPISSLQKIVPSQTMHSLCQKIPLRSLFLVHVGFDQEVLSYNGFGYLVPPKENLELLGVIFSSKVFPLQNRRRLETRLTLMFSSNCQDPQAMAKQVLEEHLQISKEPTHLSLERVDNAIPQYTLGHLDRVKAIRKEARRLSSCWHLLGNCFEAVGLGDLVAQAKRTADLYITGCL